MNLCLDFLWGEDFLDYSVFVNEICGAQYADGLPSACHLFSPASQLLQQSGLRVGYQRELQAVSVGKLLLQCLFVFAHTDDFISGGCQFLFVCLQRTSLCSASACVSLWIAVYHQFPAAIVACLNLSSVLVDAEDLWYSVSDIHNDLDLYYCQV